MHSDMPNQCCFHCGDAISGTAITTNNHAFCCEGCKTVFEILDKTALTNYYNIENHPGISRKTGYRATQFAYLDNETIQAQLISFTDDEMTSVRFSIPAIHCSSCLWLLENLYRLHPAITNSRVNFLEKEVQISFHHAQLSLRQLAELLASIGYEPSIQLDSLNQRPKDHTIRRYWFKTGVAFFCFGNIMLFTFPEYLGLNSADNNYRILFGYLNFLLSLPVMFYSATEFFVSAWKGLQQRILNMDVPIALGLVVMFVRSAWIIFTHQGAGYMDTLASLTLLMLIGRVFQQRTYRSMQFDRDYQSYFPVSVTIPGDDQSETTKPVSAIQKGDRLLIRNDELVPADAILIKGAANIDYGFVTGESIPVEKQSGDMLYAGGRQKGTMIEVEVVKPVSQSYLTQLWNNEVFTKSATEGMVSMANRFSKYFTIIILLLSAIAATYWLLRGDATSAMNAFTGILIITCPCALALSTPFTLGNALRILGGKKIYLKNTLVIEKLSRISSIVFDKTGTITLNKEASIEFTGAPLSTAEKMLIKTAVYASSHPLSRLLYRYLDGGRLSGKQDFRELPGSGLETTINGIPLRIGSRAFIKGDNEQAFNTEVHIEINHIYRGCFLLKNKYRKGFEGLMNSLGRKFRLSVLSGDNNSEEDFLQKIMPRGTSLQFNQNPEQKLASIDHLQQSGEQVLMIGDGLNDAGALRKSDVGISITEDTNNFTPACDVIMDASMFEQTETLLRFARRCMNIIRSSFVLSLLYNIIGIYFAVQAKLSPLVAAVLMPLSSVTIGLFTTTAAYFAARIFKKNLLLPAESPVTLADDNHHPVSEEVYTPKHWG
jgi:P-type Cu+ transporter